MAPASTYDMLGAYAYLIELWGSPVSEADEDGDGRVSDEEYLKWTEIELTGEGWIMPHVCQHPDYGKIWIGGTRKKHTSRTPPARYIEMEALKNAQFVMYCASQFPRVKIKKMTATAATHQLFWIDVLLKNEHAYPTMSDRSLQLKLKEKDLLIFNASKNITPVEITKGATQIDPADESRKCEVLTKKKIRFRLKGKESKRFRILVKIEGNNGWVEYLVKPQYGPKSKKRMEIKVQ